MGCGCGKGDGVHDPSDQARRDEALARKLQREEEAAARRNGGGGGGSGAGRRPSGGGGGRGPQAFSGQGNVLGGADTGGDGLTAEERRQKVLEAAEKRQNNVQGISETKVAQMREKQQKEELLGKISEYYNRKKLEMPMGMNASTATVEQLRRHWDALRKGESSADKVLDAA